MYKRQAIDGDLDAVVGSRALLYEDASLLLYVNEGGGNYAKALDLAELAATTGYVSVSRPACGDVDGDGVAEVVAITRASSPDFQLIPSRIYVGESRVDFGRSCAPALGDLDGDGLLDLVVGVYSIPLRYLKNTGSATAPEYTAIDGAGGPPV